MARSKLSKNLKTLQDSLGWLIVAMCLILAILYAIALYLTHSNYYLQVLGIIAIAIIVTPKNRFPNWVRLTATIALCLIP
jgi:membrane protein YdbS with pleckstrin-like domain